MTTTPVRHHDAMGLTYQEIAARYGVSLSTVKQTWRHHPKWPKPLPDKRGRHLLFPEDAVAAVRAEFQPHQYAVVNPRELVSLRQVSERTGIPLDTLNRRAYEDPSRRRRPFPASVGVHRDVTLWWWAEVTDWLSGSGLDRDTL